MMLEEDTERMSSVLLPLLVLIQVCAILIGLDSHTPITMLYWLSDTGKILSVGEQVSIDSCERIVFG
jgi:hypothetical protein